MTGMVEGLNYLPQQMKAIRYEDIVPQLAAIEMSPNVNAVLVILNTVGGDVEAGLAIAEAISGLSKPTASIILGGGHSIGLPIAVAADRTFIAPSATIIVHPIRLNGQILAVAQTFDQMEKTHSRIIRFVCRHSQIKEDDFRALMKKEGEIAGDVGTILVGEEAVSWGLIDAVGTISDALEYLRDVTQIGTGGKKVV